MLVKLNISNGKGLFETIIIKTVKKFIIAMGIL